MSSTFFVTLVVALIAVFCWRVVVMVAIAVLLAFVLTGISTVSSVLAGEEGQSTIVIAPGEPARPPDGPAANPGDQGAVPEGDPQVGEQEPPR